MKKVVFIFLAVAFSAVTSGQIINISGNWTINIAKSALSEQFSMAPKMCVINQNDSVLILEKKIDFQGQEIAMTEKFKLDGSECSNPGFMESVKKSKVTLMDDNKTIKIISIVKTQDFGDIGLLELYSFDKENLIYKFISSSSSFGEMSETAAYNKN